jgi:Domain of unknown function (DUF4389)
MTQATTLSQAPAHPVRLVNEDDLRRSRLTVFFRLLLAIPHVIVLALWGLVMVVVALVNWVATLVGGRLPEGLHEFTVRFLRYLTHVYAYINLVADPFPPFAGAAGSYPIDIEVDPPATQNRWTVFFRLVLAIPAVLIASVFRSLIQVLAFVGWFYALATGRMSQGIRDLAAYVVRYEAQTFAYMMLLTQRYPSLSGGPAA